MAVTIVYILGPSPGVLIVTETITETLLILTVCLLSCNSRYLEHLWGNTGPGGYMGRLEAGCPGLTLIISTPD